MFLADAQVAGQSAFQAAAHGVTIHRSNEHRTRFLQRLESRAEFLCHQARPYLIAIREFLEVGACAEELLAMTSDHYRAYLRISIQIADERVKLRKPCGSEGVG